MDKNSFLLPYFNHKSCLGLSVASSKNETNIFHFENGTKIINCLFGEDKEKLVYCSSITLREDKFKDYSDHFGYTNISSGLWQLLVMLQTSKIWTAFEVKKNLAELYFDKEKQYPIYHCFDIPATEKEYTRFVDYEKDNLELVGKLTSNEIHLFNKLFSNSKKELL